MIINLDNDRGSITHHMIFNSVDSETIKEITSKDDYTSKEVNIELYVNGVKCDISKFVKVLEEQNDKELANVNDFRNMTRDKLLEDFKAYKNKKLEEELDKIMDVLYDFKNRSDEIIDKLYK